MVTRTLRDEGGQGLGEYGVILGLVAVLCMAALAFLGSQISGQLSSIGSSYP